MRSPSNGHSPNDKKLSQVEHRHTLEDHTGKPTSRKNTHAAQQIKCKETGNVRLDHNRWARVAKI